jgi:hypothetical protein
MRLEQFSIIDWNYLRLSNFIDFNLIRLHIFSCVVHRPFICERTTPIFWLHSILDTHLFNFPSNYFVSNVSLSRHKRQGLFFKNQNGFLIPFSSLLLLRRSFCFNFSFFYQKFQNYNFLSRKAPGSIPWLVSCLSCWVLEVKNRQRTGSEKKRKVMGVLLSKTLSSKLNKKNDGTQKSKKEWERYSSFISLFHFVNSF